MKALRVHDVLPEPPLLDDDPLRLLTIPEVARELRCSKAHLHNIIAGKVRNLPCLPVLRLGRRRLIRQEALMHWMLSLEAQDVEGQKLSGLFR